MNSAFKIGEVAILCNARFNPSLNGMECEITGGLELREVTQDSSIALRYAVRGADGNDYHADPHQLRRRKPPTTGEESVLAMFKPATKREGAPA